MAIRHSLAEGLTAEEVFVYAAAAREGLFRILEEAEKMWRGARDRLLPKSFNVLARAYRSRNPGIVFARAAASGEVDPLVDVDSRAFVGLPIVQTKEN